MPLDPSIITRVQPPPVASPLDALSTVTQLQAVREQTEARRLAADKARQQAMDDAAIRNAMTAAGGDWEKALPQLRTIAPTAAAKLETDIATARSQVLDGQIKEQDLRAKKLDLGLKLLGGVTDQPSYDLVRPMIGTMSPEIAKQLGETYDPARVQTLTTAALTAKERTEQRAAGLKQFLGDNPMQGLGTYLSTIDNADEWDAVLKTANRLGMPSDALATFGTFSPDNAKRAAKFAISPEKQAELAGQAAARTQTAAHQAIEEQQGAGRLAVEQGQLGVARAREAREAAKPAGSGTRPVTSGDANKIADLNTSRTDLATLATTISSSGATGLGAQVGAALPPWITDVTGWGTDAKKKQALIDMVKQVIGKTLEGGVLRKEDEVKYEKILPTIKDTNEVVLSKLQGVDQALIDKRQSHLDALADAGYDISRFAARPTSPPLGQTKTGPAAGDRVRVVGPNGQTGTVPKGTALPAGWRLQ